MGSYKTELIADRVWRSATEVELATVGWVGWYNNIRLHGELGDIPPAEYRRGWLAAAHAGAVTRGAGGLSTKQRG